MPMTDQKKKNALSLLAFIALFQIMGGLMGWVTSKEVDGWYKTLERSPLNPPEATFGIVWTALYLMLAFAAWKIWSMPESRQRSVILALFGFHMLLNWAWTPVFFTLHAVLASLIVIAVMIITAALLGWMIRKHSSAAALVFVPYTAWLCFAAHLTQYIYAHN